LLTAVTEYEDGFLKEVEVDPNKYLPFCRILKPPSVYDATVTVAALTMGLEKYAVKYKDLLEFDMKPLLVIW
jgi:hypothetical protein